jgi:hypothetical protein
MVVSIVLLSNQDHLHMDHSIHHTIHHIIHAHICTYPIYPLVLSYENIGHTYQLYNSAAYEGA